jgi:predicted transposase YbfD/YdcC
MELLSDWATRAKPRNGTRHDFLELLVVTISAGLWDCATIEDVAAWSRPQTAWLRQFIVLKNGIPSKDAFLLFIHLLDPIKFERSFRQWVSSLIPNLSGTIAVDGKTIWCSGCGGETAVHMVSAFATRRSLVLGQEKVSAKSVEITAFPELHDALYVKCFLVSIYAMGCKRAIAEKIIAKGTDYLLVVKGNQPNLHQAIQDAFIDRKNQFIHTVQIEQGHGRLVTRRCSVPPATGIVPESDWQRCPVIARIDSVCQVKDKPFSLEQSFYMLRATLHRQMWLKQFVRTGELRTSFIGCLI